jgi:hypothetical protein
MLLLGIDSDLWVLRADLARLGQGVVVTRPRFNVSGDKGFDLRGCDWIEWAGHVDSALDVTLSDTRSDIVQWRIATTPPPHGNCGKNDEQRMRSIAETRVGAGIRCHQTESAAPYFRARERSSRRSVDTVRELFLLLMSSAPGIQRRRRHIRGVKFTRRRVRYSWRS